jgi:hypothetical protein
MRTALTWQWLPLPALLGCRSCLLTAAQAAEAHCLPPAAWLPLTQRQPHAQPPESSKCTHVYQLHERLLQTAGSLAPLDTASATCAVTCRSSKCVRMHQQHDWLLQTASSTHSACDTRSQLRIVPQVQESSGAHDEYLLHTARSTALQQLPCRPLPAAAILKCRLWYLTGTYT